MDRLTDFFSGYLDKGMAWYEYYYERVMAWYSALPFFEQMVALFVVFVVVLGIFALVMIRRAF